MKKIFSSAIILLISVLVFSGCTNSSDIVLDVSDFSQEDLTPVKGGTIKLYCDTPDTLNPIVTGYKSVSEAMYLVYDGLFITESNFSATPVLASSSTAEAGNTRYIIKLRKKVKFHDGTDFGSEDVISTLNYIGSTNSKYKYVLNKVTSYYAPDDETVVFELSSPQVNFENLLDFPILPSECGSSDYLAENKNFVPCGTGKFRVENVGNNMLVLERNKDNNIGNEPYADNVNITYVKDGSIARHTFEALETDVITTDLYSWGDIAMKGDFSTYEYESNRMTFVGLNCSNFSLSDKNVRKAIGDAIDKNKLVSDIMYTHAAIVNTPINPNAFFASVGYVTDRYEAGEAITELKNAGWLDLNNDGILDKYAVDTEYSLSFNVVVDSENNNSVRIAQILADDLKKEGIELNVVPLTYYSYLAAVENGEYDMFIGRVDISNDCDISFLLKSGGNQNHFNYSSQAMDDALYKISTAVGESGIKSAYKNFESVFREELPIIPLYFENDAVFASVYIKGDPAISRTGIYTGFENVYVKYK